MRGGTGAPPPRPPPPPAALPPPTAANARAGSLGDDSIVETAPPCEISDDATLFQCAPPSRVSCTKPLEVPAQISLPSLAENASALIAGPVPPRPARPPTTPVSPSAPFVRSGLSWSQCIPLSCVASRYCV